jgi:hypothetical protein
MFFMSTNQNNEFDVLKVVELARYKKYEITSAGFAVLDKIDRINSMPKKMKTRKPAVQALHALSDGLVKYDYFSIEERRKLMQEAGMSDAPYKQRGLFNNANAPMAEEDLEEEYIPEDEPKPITVASEDGFDEEMDDDADYEDDDFEDESEDSEEATEDEP